MPDFGCARRRGIGNDDDSLRTAATVPIQVAAAAAATAIRATISTDATRSGATSPAASTATGTVGRRASRPFNPVTPGPTRAAAC